MEDKKISLPEIIIMVMIVGSADLFGLFSGFIAAVPVIGQVLVFFSFYISLAAWLIIQFWLIMKTGVGLKDLWYTGASLFDIFSGGILPFQTPALLVNIYLTNNPKIAKVVGAVKGKTIK